jgi:endo-1,4-beta-xylanase
VLSEYAGYTASVCVGGDYVISGAETGEIYKYDKGHIRPSSLSDKIIAPAYTEIAGDYNGCVRALAYGNGKFVAAGDGAVLCFNEADASYTVITEYQAGELPLISKPAIKNVSGNAAESFAAGETLYISAEIDNVTADTVSAVIYTAFYTDGGRLTKAAVSEHLSIGQGKRGVFRTAAVVPQISPSYIKVFIWDGENGINPLYSGEAKFENNLSLAAAYSKNFPIGAAVSSSRLNYGPEIAVLKAQFSSLTAEYEMKWNQIQPAQGVFNFAPADAIVEFANENGMTVRGHTFVWHAGNPDWLFTTSGADGGAPTRTELLNIADIHIRALMERYKGKIYCWDAVNEALSDAGGETYRTEGNAWLSVIGPDYVKEIFKIARNAANDIDNGVKLYYNDYNLEFPDKLGKAVDMINYLNENEKLVDGIGLQAHLCVGNPGLSGIERAIQTFSAMGLEVQITELDVSVYPDREPQSAYTAEMAENQADWYGGLFNLFRENSSALTGVTFWGVSDANSWLNQGGGLPDAPLLFDGNYKPKSAFFKLLR